MNTNFLSFPITVRHLAEVRERTERRRLVLGTGRRRDRHLAVVIPLPVAPSPVEDLREAS